MFLFSLLNGCWKNSYYMWCNILKGWFCPSFGLIMLFFWMCACTELLVQWLEWKRIWSSQSWIRHTHQFLSLLFTSGITLVGHAKCWKLPLCEREAQKSHFRDASHWMRKGDPGRGKAKRTSTFTVGGREDEGDWQWRRKRLSERFWGSAIVWLPCIVAARDEKKLLVFLKAQEAGVRVESGGERGEEAVRAATQLSDISNQTERRHLRHSCKTARKQDCCLTLFVLDYSHPDILFLELQFPLFGTWFFAARWEAGIITVRRRAEAQGCRV